ASFGLAIRYAGRLATSSVAFWAARARAASGEAGVIGDACAVAVMAATATAAPTTSTVPAARARLGTFTGFPPQGRTVTIATDPHVYLMERAIVNTLR